MPMQGVCTTPNMKTPIRCTLPRTSNSDSITSYAIGNTPTTASARTSRSPTSRHWNSSPVGKLIGERQSVTNLLDEYTSLHFIGAASKLTLLHLRKGNALRCFSYGIL